MPWDAHLPECEEQEEDKPCICDTLTDQKRSEEAEALVEDSLLKARHD